MKANYQQRYKDMTQNDWAIAKYLTVDLMISMHVRTKTEELYLHNGRMKKICLFGNDTLMSMLLKF